ncbi:MULTISPECIES: phage major tail tube protein [Burkholderia]|uniref:Phage major tail tube protein n=1 Tax=Burkholderia cenocepacia TaxID=95486 RepID=A0A6B2MBZ0_9BURK|nr:MULTISPECIES: phage major tail tube protein [Burkholderia]ARL98155.1 phage major tail tube protein [Burkholderia pseudomallei]MDR8106993.1 phage major tail tube protein [Burkholderia cenocepacia]MDV3100722.1 phage major tail tube protein [Burkholderia cenocepacia]NDV73338.1 phage major tail tube protein [Burkholderia cenocepacia]PRG70972.1 phage major tail tube protein [Burkholderia cenocepacia]
MALPSKLKNFNVYEDGVSFVGEVAEIQLPKLTRKMEAYRGGGMNGEVDIDLGMEKLELGLTMGGFMKEMFKTWGTSKVDSVTVRFAGSYQRDDTEEVDAIEVYVRGRYKEIDPGKAKAGDNADQTGTMSLAYYRLVCNGETLIEIDFPNFIEMVGGVDRLAQQRRALGL